MIDSHCHLHYSYEGKTTEQVVEEARLAGVSHLVTVGVDFETLAPIQDISERFENVFHTVGVHPHDANSFLEAGDAGVERLRVAARHPKCRAVGEIGLDYFYEHSDRIVQQEWLVRQLDLALELKLPVVIHSRDGKPKEGSQGAEAELLTHLTRYSKKVDRTVNPFAGIIHCFTGTHAFATACIDLGFAISFSGVLTFKNAEELRSSARALPLGSLLVETDAPYLAPMPFRGKKCEPAMVIHTARVLAEVRGIPFEEVDAQTTANAKCIFRIEN